MVRGRSRLRTSFPAGREWHVWAAQMGLAGPHDIGTETRQVLSESQRVWLAHARARDGASYI